MLLVDGVDAGAIFVLPFEIHTGTPSTLFFLISDH
jgi:hypothetical protein